MSARDAPDADPPPPSICERQHGRDLPGSLGRTRRGEPGRARPPTAQTMDRDASAPRYAKFSRPTARPSSSSTARPRTRSRSRSFAGPFTASSATSAPTSRRTNAARRNFSPAAPSCCASAGRTGRSTSKSAAPFWAAPRRPFHQGARPQRHAGDRGGHGLFVPDELDAIADFAPGTFARPAHGRRAFRQRGGIVRLRPEGNHLAARCDVLSFGGTKNGIAAGELVVFFNRELAREFDYRVKQGGQLASKTRFLAAPWTGLLAQ